MDFIGKFPKIVLLIHENYDILLLYDGLSGSPFAEADQKARCSYRAEDCIKGKNVVQAAFDFVRSFFDRKNQQNRFVDGFDRKELHVSGTNE